MRHDRFDGVLGSVSPFTLTNLVAGTYQFYYVALRTISGFASLTGEFTVNVNLTSAVTAALAADLSLDIFAISVSLVDCSDGRSLSVFRA